MGGKPVLFTVEFRRKMAELPHEQRQEWLASVAAKVARAHGVEPDRLLQQELREVARGCRLRLVDAIQRELGPFDASHLRAVLEVPRESFVSKNDVARSADDVPLPLDPAGLATISAPHAYLLSYRLLALAPGDALIELGTGSGYGAALAAFIVGPSGRVASFEIDADLAQMARGVLDGLGISNALVFQRDAIGSVPYWGDAKKVSVTFAVDTLPPEWLQALPEGGLLVAPVGAQDRDQQLVLVAKKRGRVVETRHGAVRYVRNRSLK